MTNVFFFTPQGTEKLTKFTLATEDMTNLEMNSLISSKSHLQIEVIVTENSTGIIEKAVAPKCPFVNSRYIISFEKTLPYFMPALSFEVKVGRRTGDYHISRK